MDRRDRLLDIAVVDEISLYRIHVTFNNNFDAEGVSVHPTALMPIGEARQVVGGLKGEALRKGDAHRARSVGGKTQPTAEAVGWVFQIFGAGG